MIDMSRLSEDEQTELAALNAKVSVRDPATADEDEPEGRYPHWSQSERDRWRELMRKRDPAIRFALSTEEIARRFGHRSQREDSRD